MVRTSKSSVDKKQKKSSYPSVEDAEVIEVEKSPKEDNLQDQIYDEYGKKGKKK